MAFLESNFQHLVWVLRFIYSWQQMFFTQFSGQLPVDSLVILPTLETWEYENYHIGNSARAFQSIFPSPPPYSSSPLGISLYLDELSDQADQNKPQFHTLEPPLIALRPIWISAAELYRNPISLSLKRPDYLYNPQRISDLIDHRQINPPAKFISRKKTKKKQWMTCSLNPKPGHARLGTCRDRIWSFESQTTNQRLLQTAGPNSLSRSIIPVGLIENPAPAV